LAPMSARPASERIPPSRSRLPARADPPAQRTRESLPEERLEDRANLSSALVSTAPSEAEHPPGRGRCGDVLREWARGRLEQHPITPALDADPDRLACGRVVDGFNEESARHFDCDLPSSLAEDDADVWPVRGRQLRELRLQASRDAASELLEKAAVG